jgi:hypothetical protein
VLRQISVSGATVEEVDFSFCVLLDDNSLRLVADLFGSTLKSINLSYLEQIGAPAIQELFSKCSRLEKFYYEQYTCREYKIKPEELWDIITTHSSKSLSGPFRRFPLWKSFPKLTLTVCEDLNIPDTKITPCVELLESRPCLETSVSLLTQAYFTFVKSHILAPFTHYLIFSSTGCADGK